MVRLTKIYTRTGDDGTTRLVGGQQVDKDSPRIESYGTVDELNAVVGLVRANLKGATWTDGQTREVLETWLHDVQQRLFDLGSDLATLNEDQWEGQPLIEAHHVEALEQQIDAWNEALDPLKSFVLPGGGPMSALVHQARTVCRRAERRTLALARTEPIGAHVIPYLNRLSDALFVLARWVALQAEEPEILWSK